MKEGSYGVRITGTYLGRLRFSNAIWLAAVHRHVLHGIRPVFMDEVTFPLQATYRHRVQK